MIDVNSYVTSSGPCTILSEAKPKAQLVREAEALTTLDNVEYYLYNATYNTHGGGFGLFQWYKDMKAVMQTVHTAQREVRENIARLIGAELKTDYVG